MFNSKKIWFFLFFICVAIIVFAQQKIKVANNEYTAVNWDIENGLPNSTVSFILEDINGFIWMGDANGLSRFDGNTFKNYFGAKNNRNSIADNRVLRLIEDSLHNIWIGGAGLSRYDIRADTFTHIYSSDTLNNPLIEPIRATKENVYCIEGGFITAYDVHSLAKKILLKLAPADYNVGDNMSILYTIFDAQTKSVWFAEGNPNVPGGGLYQISLTGKERKHYSWACYKNIPHHSHWVESMCYDPKRNCLWINSNDGLVQFTLADKQFHYEAALDSLKDIKGYEKEWSHAHWVGIDLDYHGRVWMCSIEKGLVAYDPDIQTAFQPFANNDSLAKRVADYNLCTYCDRKGIVWLGSWYNKGVYEVYPSSQPVQRYGAVPLSKLKLNGAAVLNCVAGLNGKMWMGTDTGISVFDPMSRKFESLNLKNQYIKKDDPVIPVAINVNANKAWLISSNKYFFEMNVVNHKCNAIIYEDSAGNEIKNLLFPKAIAYQGGCIAWGMTNNQALVFIVNADSDTARQIVKFNNHEIHLYPPDIVTDNHDILLWSFKTNTTLTFSPRNGKWLQTHNPLDSIQREILFYVRKDQSFWFLNNGKLLCCNHKFQVINKYDLSDEISREGIRNLVGDSEDNIWFTTDLYIFRLDRHTGKITRLTEKDGFKRQNFGVCATPTENDIYGNLYLPSGDLAGFGNGFDYIIPRKFKESYSPSLLYLQSIQINQQKFPLSTGTNNLERLQLKYFQNTIDIETGNIDFYSKGSSHIRYKLEGGNIKNAQWQYAPNYYTIRYEQLPPADYKLTMQAGNIVDDFNGPFKILTINISPAFWNTWWFRTFASFAILAAIYLLIRYFTRQKFKLKLERSESEKQVAELKQQKTEVEMQALRAQMNPHFIFNSLNSINRFILQNNRTQASEYLTKFSKLVRMILQNSQQSLIPLEAELDSLGLYLEMEALRFNQHFEYKINVPKELDIELLQVPPLIIQPYVENAIWHGLMHKEEKGHLNIDVSQENDHLYFKVSDDGIGRKKASEIAGRSTSKHKSMGLKITAHRIAMMQQSNGKESPVKIMDLVDTSGNAAGTEVIIQMPVIEQPLN
jgi:ligand-binding sensor domain-containing protein